MDDFILIRDNTFSEEMCQEYVDLFKTYEEQNLLMSRQEQRDGLKTQKDDFNAVSNHGFHFNLESGELGNKTIEMIKEGLKEYTDQYQVLVNTNLALRHFKIQKTVKGGGYHVWHFESGSFEVAPRVLTYIVYLNDVEEGGETEFLYQSKRVKPKQGTMVLWPGSFTHAHRGNPPLTNEKYVLTGWIELV